MITNFKIFESKSNFGNYIPGDYVKLKKTGRIYNITKIYSSGEYIEFIKDRDKYMKKHPNALEPDMYAYDMQDVLSGRNKNNCFGEELVEPEDYEIAAIKYNI